MSNVIKRNILLLANFTVINILIFSSELGAAELFWKSYQKQLPFSLDADGAYELRNGDYRLALHRIFTDTSVSDSGFWYFKLGLASFHLGEFGVALNSFREAARIKPIIKPFAYEYIGDIGRSMGRPDDALLAYRIALDTTLPFEYLEIIKKKIFKILTDNPQIERKGVWYSWIYDSMSQPLVQVTVDSLAEVAADCRIRGDWDCLRKILDSLFVVESLSNRCKLYETIARDEDVDSILDSKQLFKLIQALRKCKKLTLAQKCIKKLMARKELSSEVSNKDLIYLYADTEYLLGNYKKAIDEFKKYEKTFGPTPAVILAIARSYRKLDDHNNSLKWYMRHLELYPSSSMAKDILWLKGWEEEASEKFESARSTYRRYYVNYGPSAKAEEAFIRCGLCYYKEGKYVSALTTFSAFARLHSQSSLLTTALYWKGKCELELKRYSKAKETFRNLAVLKPVDYYAFRAREKLNIIGDTSKARFLAINKMLDVVAVREWLKSAIAVSDSEVKSALTLVDSLTFELGTIMALIGNKEYAEIFLKSLEHKHSSNPIILSELAFLYSLCDASAQAFRISRKLSWRILPSQQQNIPLALYLLFYPMYYNEPIYKEALKHSIDPSLISGLIRQESIFDSKIVSPAGAVGLMQIMPYTAKTIAADLGEEFDVDSLYNPLWSIRAGVFYLRQLLDKFDQNIILALAAYNAGPDRARKWDLKNRNKSLDLFVEDIEFSETRKYVKLVQANYWTYSYLRKVVAELSEENIVNID